MTMPMLFSRDQEAGRPRVPQVAETIYRGRAQSCFNAFAALPSNIKAIEAALLFANGVHPFVAVYGPSGWGKTHLLESVSKLMSRSAGEPVEPKPSLEWVAAAARMGSSPVLIDDAQDAQRNPRAKHQLRQALERRVRSGWPTMIAFAGVKPGITARHYLPCARDWMVVQIDEPSVAERELVVRQIAANNDLLLSKGTIRLIARNLHGNGRSIEGALQRLKLAKTDWSEARSALTACGTLMPYLMGRDGWDPRDSIADAIGHALTGSPLGDAETLRNVGCYIMLECAGLGEFEVATFYGITPSGVYSNSNAVRARLADPTFEAHLQKCLDVVARTFEG